MPAAFIQQAGRDERAEDRVLARAGWVLYDGRCRMCRSLVRVFAQPLRTREFSVQPLQRRWVASRLKMQRDALRSQMWVVTKDGRVLGGAEAVVHLSRVCWWMLPVRVIARMPGGMALIDRLYRFIASHRTCDGGSCDVNQRARPRPWLVWGLDWAPLIAMPAIALACGPLVSRWIWMWMLAYALFAGCKLLTWRQAIRRERRVSVTRSMGYVFAWPGMNARAFLWRRRLNESLDHREWRIAWFKTIVGFVTLWIGCRLIPEPHPLLVGWVGMIGMITMLHFGVFHLLSLGWRAKGVNAPHLFRNPLAASSISDFWGRRWNLGFRALSYEFVFAPLHARIGTTMAMMITFVVSGLIHDLVISVPAGAGYGLPTAYFALQGLGMMLERSRLGAWLGLRRGLRGRALLLIATAAPAFFLFHPPFVERVIVPFLDVIGAI